MANYTVKDTQTGKTITFTWNGEEPPNDNDMAEVFSSARSMTPQEQPGLLKRAGNYIKEGVMGIPEAALSLGTGAVASGAGLVAGNVTAAYEGLKGNPKWGERAKEVQETTRDVLTYRPNTESGKALAELGGQAVGLPFEAVQKTLTGTGKALASIPLGEWPDKERHPNVDYAINSIAEAATLGLMPQTPKVLARVKPAIADAAAKMGITPERLYASAIKMPLSRKWTKVRGAEETTLIKKAAEKGINEEIRPSEFGLEQARHGRKTTGKQIGEEVSRTKGEASLDEVVSGGLQKARERAKNGENPVAELEMIDTYEKAFKKSRNEKLSAKELQDIKIELYDRINFDKASGKGDALVETIRKGIAHEAMTKLEGMSPKLKDLNKSDAGYILLEEALDRSLARRNNRDLFSLGTKVLIGKEALPLAIINATVGHPQVKASLAFALNRAKLADRLSKPSNPNLAPLGKHDPWADQRGWASPPPKLLEYQRPGMTGGPLMDAESRFQQAVGSPPMRGQFRPSVEGTPGSREPANFVYNTIPETSYAHPNLGDRTKTYWVSEEAKTKAAAEARSRREKSIVPHVIPNESGLGMKVEYFKDGEKVGSGQLRGDDITNIVVDEPYRRQGLGAEIMKDLMERGGDSGYAGTEAGRKLLLKSGMNDMGGGRFGKTRKEK